MVCAWFAHRAVRGQIAGSSEAWRDAPHDGTSRHTNLSNLLMKNFGFEPCLPNDNLTLLFTIGSRSVCVVDYFQINQTNVEKSLSGLNCFYFSWLPKCWWCMVAFRLICLTRSYGFFFYSFIFRNNLQHCFRVHAESLRLLPHCYCIYVAAFRWTILYFNVLIHQFTLTSLKA